MKATTSGEILWPPFGPRCRGNRPPSPGRGNCALGLVEGRPGDAERGGDIADGNAVGLVAPYHLVAHLEQVSRVKEGACREQEVANGFGMWVQHPVTRQRLALRVLSLRLGHDRLPSRSVNKNMPQLMACHLPTPYFEVLCVP